MGGGVNPTRPLVQNSEGQVLGQWPFKDSLASPSPVFGDFDSNGFKEIYLFTRRSDSLLVNWFEPYNKSERQHTRFVTRFGIDNDKKTDVSVLPVGLWDNNNDGFKELFFVINTGYSLFPRNLFVFDQKRDTVYESPESGANIVAPIADDLNGDGMPEILVSVNAVGNHPEGSIAYDDRHCWLMAFTGKAEFLFEPVKIGEYTSWLSVAPFHTANVRYIAALYVYQGTEEKECFLQLYSTEGRLIRERPLGPYKSKFEDADLLSLHPEKRDRLYLVFGNGQIEQLDSSLNTIDKYEVHDVFGGIYEGNRSAMDIDGDGEAELLFNGYKKLIITRSDFSHPVSIGFDEPPKYCVSVLKGEERELFLGGGKTSYLYSYGANPLYILQYPVWGGIYLAVSLFVWLLNYIQRYRARQQQETERRIAELQLKSVRNQTESHFNLNILNSIGSLFYKQETEKANYIFGKYAKLLRSSVITSDQVFIPLKQELEDVGNYLALEKFRLIDVFDYAINVEDGIDTELQIPKMLIHTFAENAVKHGLRHLKSGGKLQISIGKNAGGCVIRIKDNGIGREKAKEHSQFSTGRGMKILDEILALYFNLTKTKITYRVNDLQHADGSSAGTEAIIFIHLG